jgi:hypothetical protein
MKDREEELQREALDQLADKILHHGIEMFGIALMTKIAMNRTGVPDEKTMNADVTGAMKESKRLAKSIAMEHASRYDKAGHDTGHVKTFAAEVLVSYHRKCIEILEGGTNDLPRV